MFPPTLINKWYRYSKIICHISYVRKIIPLLKNTSYNYPLSITQGFYRIHVADKLIPSITYSVNNILVIFKATICQIVLPQLSPNLFHRIELWGYRRKKQQADMVKFGQLFVVCQAAPSMTITACLPGAKQSWMHFKCSAMASVSDFGITTADDWPVAGQVAPNK